MLHGKYLNKISAQNGMPFFKKFDRPYFEVHYVHHLGIFHMPQIYDMGPTALLPPEGRRAEDFFRALHTGVNQLLSDCGEIWCQILPHDNGVEHLSVSGISALGRSYCP